MTEKNGPPPTPEHEKLAARSDEHNIVSQFAEFLSKQDLLRLNTDKEIATKIAEFFNIDYKAFQKEKDVLLRWIQEQAKAK